MKDIQGSYVTSYRDGVKSLRSFGERVCLEKVDMFSGT
jgi:hypothetical protein